MKLIVGLGNPGIEYQFTPHNLGFLTVDRLADRGKISVGNRHGRAVTGRMRIGSEDVAAGEAGDVHEFERALGERTGAEVRSERPATDLIVVHDELDLPFGTVRIKQRGGTAGHNGLESILGALGTDEFIARADGNRSRSSGTRWRRLRFGRV